MTLVDKLRGGLGNAERESLAEQPPLFSIRLANGRELVTTNAEELYWFAYLKGTGTKEPPKKRGGKSKGARNRTKQKVRRTVSERS